VCGIIGYSGFRDANKVLISCLKKLEYRGYDSTGIAVTSKKQQVFKEIGEIKELEKNMPDIEGTIGIGHCLHPETLVCTTDGKLTKISEIKDTQKVLSIDFKDIKVKNGRKQRLMKHKSPEFIFKIKTSFSEFKATGKHRVFVTDGAGVKEKKVEELTGEELIAVPRKLPHSFTSNKRFKEVFVERHYKLNDELRKNLREARLKNNYTRKQVAEKTGIAISYLSRVELGERESIEEHRLKKLEHLYQKNLDISNRAGLIYRNPVMFPSKPSKELLQIIGYFIGDGFFHSSRCIRFKDARKEILDEYSSLFKKIFNLKGRIYERKGHYVLDINSKYLVDWFHKNIPELFKKTGGEEIPDFVFKTSKKQISYFLKGIYDAEGSVASSAKQVCIVMTNEMIIKNLQFFLLKFGILATFSRVQRKEWSDSFHLRINDKKSLERFKKYIGFTSQEKQRKLDELINKSKNHNYRYSSFPYNKKYFYRHYLKKTNISFHDINNSYCTDSRLENIANKLDKRNSDIKKLIQENLQSDVVWARFKFEKIKSNVESVWDLEVEYDHNFIGSMTVQHNSRWATHGGVTKANAHPHLSSNKKIAIVHNGIIENYVKLRDSLKKKGYKFLSETDSEVLAHLIQDNYKGNLEKAVYFALKKVQGYYAIVATCTDEPDKVVGARKDSPLVVGIGDNENFLASDVTAFLKYTNRVFYLNEDQIVTITNKEVQIFDKNFKKTSPKEEIINWDLKDAEKSGFPHFMLKEIYDQPDVINQVIRGRVSEIERSISFNEDVENLLKEDINSIHIVACGTSYYAGLVGKYIIEKIVDIPVFVELASEYRYFGTKHDSSLVIAITQSGETLDTLAALKEAKNSGCRTLVITNVIGSTATRLSDGYILTQSGPEIGVAATKTFTAQILTLLLIALKISSNNNKIGADELYKHILELKELPRKVRTVLDNSNEILEIARQLKNAESVFFIGRGINYPLSLEGALKLKEISYIHAEGFAVGELKHVPFALLTKMTPVVVIATKDATYDKIIANIGEIKARGPQVIAIAEENDTEIEKHADFVLRYPSNSNMLSCIPIIVILQLLAYHVANLRGCPIDKPRNLAKSVTVE